MHAKRNAKLLERLGKEVEDKNDLSQRQYGFQKNMSTVDALSRLMNVVDKAREGVYGSKKLCAMVSLDIQNAFNAVGWGRILAALGRLNLPGCLMNILKDYFINTKMVTGSRDGTHGVLQGSALEPFCWNIFYDGILRLGLKKG